MNIFKILLTIELNPFYLYKLQIIFLDLVS